MRRRWNGVGISGTKYRPLEVESQIREAIDDTCTLVNSKEDPYEKALLALLLFYEQNNISAFKKMFLEQVEFANNEYF